MCKAEALKKKVKAEKAKIEQKAPSYKELEAKVQELKAQKAKKQTYIERLDSETAKLDELEKNQNSAEKDILMKLKDLVFLNESLKLQESQFKTSCQQQRAALLALMKEIEAGDNDDETKRMMEIEQLYDADLAKLQKLRQVHISRPHTYTHTHTYTHMCTYKSHTHTHKEREREKKK